MFIPSSLGMVLPIAPLDAVDDAVWYPNAVEPTAGRHDETTPIGFNVGVLLTVSVVGEIHSLCYYRIHNDMSPSGTMSLWRIDHVTDVLLAQVSFTGHSGTGWKVVPLTEPIQSNPSYAYVAALWVPAIAGVCTVAHTPYFFGPKGRYSPNGFLYAVISSGYFDPRGFSYRNGFLKVGAFARPDGFFADDNFWVDAIINARPKPVPPLPPLTLKWPILDGYPDATTTGPDPATVFTVVNEDVRATTNGQVVEDLDVQGAVIAVQADNVTVQNCKVRSAGPFLVYVYPGTTGTIVQNCELDGIGRQNLGACGVTIGGTDVQVLANNIYRVENGVALYGSNAPVLIKDNFIHNIRAGPGDPHYDGIQMDGGNSDTTIEHNTIYNENSHTGCIMLDNQNGDTDGVLMKNNYVSGGSYSLYCVANLASYALTDIQYVDNVIRSGAFGYFAVAAATPTLQGNRYLSHGGVYDTPPAGGFSGGEDVPENFFGIVEPAASPVGEAVDVATGGITVGMSFTTAKAGHIIGVNLGRPNASSTVLHRIGIWRYLGSDQFGGTELLVTQEFPNVIKTGIVFLELTTPLAVAAHDNLLVGAFIPRGHDGNVWYLSKAGFFWPSAVPSQWGTMTAFSNNSALVVNGFASCNGMYTYAADLVPPLLASGADANFFVDPIFTAAWS